ncbi:MAG: ABC transporter permease subunit [Clostridiales bacterium]|nr:ABC transporter permease subunit [Clostridiales bacterium]
MKAKQKQILWSVFYPAVILIGAFALWEISAILAGSEFIFPSVESTLKAFVSLLGKGETYAVLWGSVYRTLISYGISLVVALVCMLLSVQSLHFRKLITPVVNALRALPTMAVTLILAIWAGPRLAPVIVSLLVIMPTAYASFYEGAMAIEKDVLSMAQIDGATKKDLALRFTLPLSVIYSRRSVSATLALNLKLMVAAETLAGTARSIGHSMMLSSIYFETATLMALTVITVFLSLLMQWGMYRLLVLITPSTGE